MEDVRQLRRPEDDVGGSGLVNVMSCCMEKDSL